MNYIIKEIIKKQAKDMHNQLILQQKWLGH
jgi:hypothetical protein